VKRRPFLGSLLSLIGIVEAMKAIDIAPRPVIKESTRLTLKPFGWGLRQIEYWNGKRWLVKWTGWKAEQDSVSLLCGQWYTANRDANGKPCKEMFVSGAPGEARKMMAGERVSMDTSKWKDIPSSETSPEDLELMKIRAMNALLALLDAEVGTHANG
jgi:hypothetical protein